LLTVLTVFLILLFRPSILIHSSLHKSCPYCLNPWMVTLVVLLVAGGSYVMINSSEMPEVELLN
jgi:hypothetical protein